MSKITFVVIEDDADIRLLIANQLKNSNHEVITYDRGDSFLNELKSFKFDFVILDIMLPGADGLEILKRLKSDPETEKIPVIMVTAKSEELDKILGLELGADDYITKPFSLREFTARIKAVLRRVSSQTIEISQEVEPVTPKNEEVQRTIIGKTGISLDENSYRAYRNGRELPLTVTEFRILSLLAAHPGWVLERRQILDQLWGDDRFSIERTVDVHIRHLRAKLGDDGSFIENVRGVGYRISESAL